MSTKSLVTMGMIIGSLIGGYVPALFGVDLLSFTSIFLSGVGGLVGIFIGYKIANL